jgi:L-lactate dehydrogenase complex protein LldG
MSQFGRKDTVRSSRESFLLTVRRAVQQGNRPGYVPEAPERGRVGYQGAGSDLVSHFCTELRKSGGHPHPVENRDAVLPMLLQLLQGKTPRRVLLARDPLIDALNLGANLNLPGVELISADTLGEDCRDAFFTADVGITGADYLIAETGSVVLGSWSDAPRSVSLLPPVHIVLAERARILPDLFDLFAVLGGQAADLPSGLTLITGPSKTGDIELRLVTGVHGPGELHVLLIAPPDS